MLNTLFVYGSLVPGQVNHDVIKDIDGIWKKGTVRGELYRFVSGEDEGYPTMTLSFNGHEVFGWVLEADSLPQHLNRLDDFEGDYYKRVSATITLEAGESIEAYLYVLNEAIPNIRSMIEVV